MKKQPKKIDYKQLTLEDVEKGIIEFFSKHKFSVPLVEGWDRTHYIIRDKGLMMIVRRDKWDEAILDSINKLKQNR